MCMPTSDDDDMIWWVPEITRDHRHSSLPNLWVLRIINMAPRLAKALSKFRVSKRNPPLRKIDEAYGIGYLWSFHDGVWGYGATAIFAAVVGLPNNLKGPHNVVWFGFLSMRLADTGRCWDSSFETREGCTTSHFKTANSEGKFWSCHPRISAAISQPGLNLWQVPAAGHYYTFHYRWDDERCKLLARSLSHPSAEMNFSIIHASHDWLGPWHLWWSN